ncbi:carbohydrate esterase family 16 protein [Phanerochaete carnosa HHB-10118-sp]|uniref:Carbohydrate esterase family 16 protein n=1 Tax=Phanerochaete carnosa (strain HHB-10118-sp) TaxID=650164 RepID=K5VV15_PHACS|nr:carbohydrate esterase family 16 protein [Phanerochaete carnosa HHB-10118-sp]EKM55348.1 carbohydrate esterase family 16 protein [Phanerochaete carnosa HHB-10118-sp]
MTWNEKSEPNWVGHLVLKRRMAGNPLLVFDYAVGGQDLEGFRQQVRINYSNSIATKPGWAPWTAEDTLFVSWIGINDCGKFYGHFDNAVASDAYQERLFQSLHEVYGTGARNFLFIDVPPMERAPGLRRANAVTRAAMYSRWNTSLHSGVQRFANSHDDASVMLLSSHELFHKVLANPENYDLDESEVNDEGGPVWFDYIHITSKMHGIVASAIEQFLSAQAPLGSG